MGSQIERTFVMVKPDGVQRGLVGAIISRLEAKGLKLAAMKMITIDKDLAESHYEAHKGKGFFEGLISYITSSPVVPMVWEGPNAVAVVRTVMGATDPASSAPGTIRGDYGVDIGFNLVHGSDSGESAVREIGLFFEPNEIVEYGRVIDKWIMP